MRPNIAQDEPPTTLTVGGSVYGIETDYRVWLDVVHQLQTMPSSIDDEEDVRDVLNITREVERLIFGHSIPVRPDELLQAVGEFARGYPSAPVSGAGGDGPDTYSLEYDLNEIIIAIRNSGGPDLSYHRKEPFHWWEFMLEVRTIAGDHAITRLMELRGYDGKDARLLALKRRYALPPVTTAHDQRLLDAVDEMFYNT